MLPQSRYLPEKLCAINLLFSNISDWIESVIWISPLFPGFCFSNFANIFFERIYRPMTALLEGDFETEGFSITSFIS